VPLPSLDEHESLAQHPARHLDPPNRIDWELCGALDAAGQWVVHDNGTDAAPETTVELVVGYDPSSARTANLPLPPLFSLDRIISRLQPVIEREARSVLTRVVTDLEGEERIPTLTISQH
jgi:hypothetical protein